MPAWTADWTDVVFDHGATAAAAEACERAARVVRASASHRRWSAAAATESGAGPWADHFRKQVDALTDRSQVVEARLRLAAQVLREASEQAHVEQAARLARRRQWELEALAEQVAPTAAPPSTAAVG